MAHDFLIILAVAVIVIIQLCIWIRSKSLIEEYIGIFRNAQFFTSKAYIPLSEITNNTVKELSNIAYKEPSEDVEDEVEITYINAFDEKQGAISHPLLLRIINAINAYLLKNKGATGDFLLIKDIVERYCDTKREEIETQLPMPLYLGLMGTMLGIIIGIGYIAIVSGFSAFIDNPSGSIGALMGGVAIAMIASLIGIVLTTYGSWSAKSASSQVEDDKNEFYTWIQTELLPVLGGSENSLMQLQENLLKFNHSFSANTTKLDKALQKMEMSYENQIELVQTIQKLNLKKMATANVSVLRELQAYTPQLERLGQYLHNANEYISHVNTLTDAINSQMNRTQLIERMGTFFEQEVKDIEQRKAAISQAVGTVDDRLRQTLHSLQENADKSMQEMNEALIRKQNIFNKAIDEQQELFKRKIQENGNILDELKKLDDVVLAIGIQGEKLDSELESLNALKAEIVQMSTNQSKKMDELITAVQNMSVEVSMPNMPSVQPYLSKDSKFIKKYVLAVFIALICAIFCAFIIIFEIHDKKDKTNIADSQEVVAQDPVTNDSLQEAIVQEEKEEPYTMVEQMPQYSGGVQELVKYISKNLRYPTIAQENGIQGRVILRFVVSASGKVEDVQVLHSLDPYCDKEAVRVVQSMPQWIPGKQDGRNVPVYYTLPVVFRLQ